MLLLGSSRLKTKGCSSSKSKTTFCRYATRSINSSRFQALWKLPIRDGIRDRDRIIRKAIKSEIDLLDALLHAIDERRQFAKTIFIRFASLDPCKRHDSVVEDPPDVGWFGGGWTRNNLAHKVGGEGCQFVDKVSLEPTIDSQRRISETRLYTCLIFRYVIRRKGSISSQTSEIHGRDYYRKTDNQEKIATKEAMRVLAVMTVSCEASTKIG